tara:strand:+ start:86 stop:406 length:321 start_codon:yes stop_codon:yes gene_type:complete
MVLVVWNVPLGIFVRVVLRQLVLVELSKHHVVMEQNQIRIKMLVKIVLLVRLELGKIVILAEEVNIKIKENKANVKIVQQDGVVVNQVVALVYRIVIVVIQIRYLL